MNVEFESFLEQAISECGGNYIEVPEEMEKAHRFSRQFRRSMRTALRQKSTFSLARLPRGRRFSMAVTITILILLALSTAIVCGGRNVLAGFFIEDLLGRTEVKSMYAEEAVPETVEEMYLPTWIPEGYKMVIYARNEGRIHAVYCNDPDCNHLVISTHIQFKQKTLPINTETYDNETAVMKEAVVNAHPAIEIDFEEEYYFIWCSGGYCFNVDVPVEFDKKTALQIAESVQKVE